MLGGGHGVGSPQIACQLGELHITLGGTWFSLQPRLSGDDMNVLLNFRAKECHLRQRVHTAKNSFVLLGQHALQQGPKS